MNTTENTLPPVRALDGDRLIFIEDLSAIINRSPAAIRYMVSKGNGPRSAKIAGRRMFKLSDVNAWIEQQFADSNA